MAKCLIGSTAWLDPHNPSGLPAAGKYPLKTYVRWRRGGTAGTESNLHAARRKRRAAPRLTEMLRGVYGFGLDVATHNNEACGLQLHSVRMWGQGSHPQQQVSD